MPKDNSRTHTRCKHASRRTREERSWKRFAACARVSSIKKERERGMRDKETGKRKLTRKKREKEKVDEETRWSLRDRDSLSYLSREKPKLGSDLIKILCRCWGSISNGILRL